MIRSLMVAALVMSLSLMAAVSRGAELNKLPESAAEAAQHVEWGTDYHAAIQAAKANKQLALLWFYDEAREQENAKFASAVLASPEVEPLLKTMSLVKLPTTAAIENEDEEITLLKHSSFRELLGGPGLAMIDLRDAEQKYFGWVVSVYPFHRGAITTPKLKVLCDLPAGTLSQRTLIFAVRTHPAAPQSAWSPHNTYLCGEAEKHSLHQASINLQGHHNWESRFHQINAGIGSGSAKEVCAESWPGQNLLDAAEECVHSWSQSSGHWAGVSARHAFFGYDMKRGTNGVWYATGIFTGG